jgi:hypothetical protein
MTAADEPWMTVKEAALYARRHPKTILAALRRQQAPGGAARRQALAGVQPRANCTWRVRPADLDRWLAGEPPKRLRKTA